MALMHEDFFTLGGIFALAGFVVEEFYCNFACHPVNVAPSVLKQSARISSLQNFHLRQGHLRCLLYVNRSSFSRIG